MARVMREASLLKSLDHPFCINLFGSLMTNDYLYLILEFAEGNVVVVAVVGVMLLC